MLTFSTKNETTTATGTGTSKKEIGFNKQNNNSARFFNNFFAAPAQPRREIAKF